MLREARSWVSVYILCPYIYMCISVYMYIKLLDGSVPIQISQPFTFESDLSALWLYINIYVYSLGIVVDSEK
jgi:hypothetical protein